MKFFTKYDFEQTVSESGSGVHPVYEPIYDKNGHMTIQKKQTKDKKGNVIDVTDDVYSKIQASADSVDINTIIKKFTKTGDESLLHVNPGQYIDMTELPKSPLEMLEMINKAKRSFEELPNEIKEKFGYDVNQFIAESNKNTFLEKLGLVPSKEEKIEKGEEVKGEEVNG